MVDSISLDKGCEVFDDEENDEEWDKNDNRNVVYGDNTHILIKWGIIIKCYRG